MTATVEQREYSSGRRFYLVVCETCLAVINSGHHFSTAEVARRWADEHNASPQHVFKRETARCAAQYGTIEAKEASA
jgi:hypothetical protein